MERLWAEGTTVLAVEDDLLTAKLIRARMELDGLRVLEARNGREALELLKSEGADLVSTDLMMPSMDGYRLIREIRELPPPLGQVPILVLSVNSGEEDLVRCLAAGADDYIQKPLSPQVYIEKLWRLYLRSRG
ncbi:MAG: response regulator [Geothrix sp.]|nr:response regulator [Geothrix sp.]